jgi:hypothetical protein
VNSQFKAYSYILNDVINSNPRIKLIEVGKFLCSNGTCTQAIGDKILYRDYGHLNINGSKYLGKKISENILFP